MARRRNAVTEELPSGRKAPLPATTGTLFP